MSDFLICTVIFWHTEHTFLIVYDDDFKLSGPKDKQQISWDLIAKTLGLDLSCTHIHSTATLPNGSMVYMITLEMEECMRSCAELGVSLAPP